jgi:elongation factor 2
MVRYKQTHEILRLIKDRENVRNIGIIAHIDHGKTTLTDSLLAASGLLSPTVAGEARALDYLEEEQKRGITIKTANISLLHDYDGRNYVINLIDTPGHVDFTGKVTRAMRAIDGAVVVVDAVEEVMVQTETVTRQALQERVKPILFINKVDRLITELRLGPQDIQKKLARIIQRFNQLINIFGEEGFKEKWVIKPELNNVAFGSAKDRWGFTLKKALEKGMTFNDVLKYYEEGRLDELRELFPIHEAVLDMVVEHVPTPIEAQKYRIPRIWKGDLDSEIGRAMINCDENGPVAFMITNVTVDEKAGLVATGRLLSGTLEPGIEVYLINRGKKDRVLQVGMYMGPYREVVEHMIAGNIPAVLGLDDVTAGETVSTYPDMVPFEAIQYISEPVVTVSIEPKNTRDLPKLINSLRKLAIEDPNLHVKINEETGEYLLSGMGTLHLEVSLHFLQDMGIDVIVSQPIVVYRETITKNSPIFPGKSPNKHNKIKVRLERLDDDIVDLIVSNKLNERLGRREIQRILVERGWSADEARSVWAIDNEGGNILIDLTRGVQYLQESKQMLIGAFFDFVKEGALAREPVRGVKVVLLDAMFHEDPAHRTLAQVVPMLHRALLGAELASEPSLYEPIMRIQVQVPSELIGAVTSVMASKRGQVSNIEQREYYSVVNGYIPVSETFDLAQVLRSATGGRAFWQTQFSHWQLIPKSLLPTVVSEIRRRKGLSEAPPEYREFIPPGEEIEEVRV